MSTILVTGGTGGLGRPTVSALLAAKHDVRILSRRPGERHVIGDLATGEGLSDALQGVDTVLHLATNRKKDAADTARLLDAARDVQHIIYISIVGVDHIPFPYYVDKLATEKLIERAGIPYTILRATQFHDFVGDFLRAQRRLPVVFSAALPIQTIAVEEVAGRLAELARSAPAGRVPDIGGPQLARVGELVELWQQAFGTRKPVWTLRLPGKTMRAFAAGHHTTGLPGYGHGTFAEYAAREAAK